MRHLHHVVGVLAFTLSLSLSEIPVAAGEGRALSAPVNQPRRQIPPDPGPVSEPPPPPESAALSNMVMRPLGPGRFEIGKVRLDKAERTVSFPAEVNMREGPVEYFLVTTYGKTHESVLRTSAQPYHIHMAMLLLDARGSSETLAGAEAAPRESRPTPISQPASARIGGDPVEIDVAWTTEGRAMRCGAAEFLYNLQTRAPMAPGPWTYNGSMVVEGTFRAQIDGSVAALVSDSSALINNPRPGFDNDEIWTTNTNRIPARGTPVDVVLRLKPAAATAP